MNSNEKTTRIEAIDWNNPNLLVGKETPREIAILTAIETERQKLLLEEVRQELQNSCYRHSFDFTLTTGLKEKYLLCFSEQKTISSIRIFQLERYYLLDLDKTNPYRWQFVPFSFFNRAACDTSNWDFGQLSGELARWCPVFVEHPKKTYLERIARHYTIVFLWLRFHQMWSGTAKDALRELLYTTDLIYGKPYADLSLARLEFARQLYPRSTLAQRAGGEAHLWLCMEYSAYLQKFIPRYESVDNCRTNLTKSVRWYRKMLNQEFLDSDPILPEWLHDAGMDWRLFIEDLLLEEAIQLIDNDSDDFKDLKHHTRQFLTAKSHYNGIVGHSERHIVETSGETRIKQKQKRGRGRPPKGS